VPDVDVPLYRKRSLLLPLDLDLKSALATSAGQKSDQGAEKPETPAEKEEKSAQRLLDKYNRLNIAISELVKQDPNHFQVEIPANHDGVGVDPKFTRSTILGDQLEFRSSLRKVALTRSSLTAGSGGPSIALADPGTLADEPSKPPTLIQTEPTGAFTLAKDLLSSAGLLGPLGPWKHVPAEKRTPRMKQQEVAKLSETTTKILKDQGIDASAQPINGQY
jgi:hypothetical protein